MLQKAGPGWVSQTDLSLSLEEDSLCSLVAGWTVSSVCQASQCLPASGVGQHPRDEEWAKKGLCPISLLQGGLSIYCQYPCLLPRVTSEGHANAWLRLCWAHTMTGRLAKPRSS